MITSENDPLQRAFRASLRLNFMFVFVTYPYTRNKPNEVYTEFTEGFFGERMITTSSAPFSFKWRDYITRLYTSTYSPTKTINITGPATLTAIGDIAGITSALASITRTADLNNSIVIYYEGLVGSLMQLIYKEFTYNIPINLGKNFIAIGIYGSIIVYDETGGLTNIPIMASDPPVVSEEWTLNMYNIKLYALNLFKNLNTQNLIGEGSIMKLMAEKRIK